MSLRRYSSHRSIEIRCADSCEKSFPDKTRINPARGASWQILDGAA
jgi:hypothetical protein